MSRNSTVLLAGSFLLLCACAHSPIVTPVNLTVTSETVNKRFVSDVRDATLRAIRQQVPEARPMTITADLDVANDVVNPSNALAPIPVYRANKPVASVGPDPWGAGAIPTVQENSWGPPQRVSSTDIYLAYTIRDANGRVLDSRQLRLEIGLLAGSPDLALVSDSISHTFKDPFTDRRAYVIEAADFLASRVKTLSH